MRQIIEHNFIEFKIFNQIIWREKDTSKYMIENPKTFSSIRV